MQLKKYTLGEIAEINASSIKLSDKIEEILYLDTTNITENKIDVLQKCDYKDAPSRAQRKVKNNTIIFSTVRPNQKHFGIMKNPPFNLIVSSGFATLDIKDKEEFDADYLYYKLTQPFLVNYLQTVAQNQVSAYPSINPSDLSNLNLSFPPLPVQQKIAAVLSALDEKIALNSRINAKLEAMAKRLYDYWFVQFEFPFDFAQGKPDADGTFGNIRPPISQAGHTSTPAGQSRTYKTGGGKMVWNEQLKREIPEGWEVKRLGDVDVVKRGTTITEKETTTGNIKVVAGGLDYSYTHGKSNRRENCITISGSGENAGFINFWREPIFASDCSTVQFSDDLDTIMCYFSLKMYEHIFFRKSHKSAQPHIYPADIYEMPFIIPPKEIKEKVRNFFISQNSKIATLQQQSAKLTALRDRLLPLLMNGQVAVSDNSEQAKQNSGLDYEKKFNKWLQNQGLAARGHVDMKTLHAIFNAMDDDDK